MRVCKARIIVGVAAVLLILLALANLARAERGVAVTALRIEEIPARLYRPAPAGPGPVVVIAHGFAGSQQLMQSFALAAARNGYSAVTFDFAGHGRNPAPLGGSITAADDATRTLQDELATVAAWARTQGDGRVALLGHSMASDIVVRQAQGDPAVAATIAVSMFSPVVTATAPRNLLVIAGAWEGMLKAEALRVVGLVTATPAPQVTYGSFADGTARRAAFSPFTEHASVLFSRASLREAVAWLDQTFGTSRAGPPVIDARGPWIMALIAGVVALAWPLAGLLPVVARPPRGAGLDWRRLWLPLTLPALATPLLLRIVPIRFLPIVVGDYLAAHFFVYGLLTLACLAVVTARRPAPANVSRTAFVAATGGVLAYAAAALIWPIDTFVTAFVPGEARAVLTLAMGAGTLPYMLADEWMTRRGARGAYAASKAAFVLSLALAVALDFERLFFLIIIIPVTLLFFVVFGLFSRWIYRRTGHPGVSGTAHAILFAWSIGVTFPLLAG